MAQLNRYFSVFFFLTGLLFIIWGGSKVVPILFFGHELQINPLLSDCTACDIIDFQLQASSLPFFSIIFWCGTLFLIISVIIHFFFDISTLISLNTQHYTISNTITFLLVYNNTQYLINFYAKLLETSPDLARHEIVLLYMTMSSLIILCCAFLVLIITYFFLLNSSIIKGILGFLLINILLTHYPSVIHYESLHMITILTSEVSPTLPDFPEVYLNGVSDKVFKFDIFTTYCMENDTENEKRCKEIVEHLCMSVKPLKNSALTGGIPISSMKTTGLFIHTIAKIGDTQCENNKESFIKLLCASKK